MVAEMMSTFDRIRLLGSTLEVWKMASVVLKAQYYCSSEAATVGVATLEQRHDNDVHCKH